MEFIAPPSSGLNVASTVMPPDPIIGPAAARPTTLVTHTAADFMFIASLPFDTLLVPSECQAGGLFPTPFKHSDAHVKISAFVPQNAVRKLFG